MMSALKVTVDVYDTTEMFLANGATQQFRLTIGNFGSIDEAYWYVSVFPTRAVAPIGFPPQPSGVQVSEQRLEVQPNGRKTLVYEVRNPFPQLPVPGLGVMFKRELVRVPARP
jgi:hypothetical protein